MTLQLELDILENTYNGRSIAFVFSLVPPALPDPLCCSTFPAFFATLRLLYFPDLEQSKRCKV